VPKGKPWTVEEENKLRELVSAEEPLGIIAAKLGKSEQAIVKKIERLGLKVVVQAARKQTTTSEFAVPMELPSVEEALKMLAGALKMAAEPDLSKVEVQRLRVVAALAKTYKELLTDYIDYRGIEAKLVEMEEKYAQLAEKAKDDASKPNTS